MRQSKRMTMVLALLLSVIGADVFAQKGADSVWVDSVEVDSVALAEEFKSDYDSEEDKARMDSLIQSRYVIVSMNGKYGIYDREKNDSVTAVDMEYIEYSHYFQPEDGMCFCYFYYEKGLQCGKIGINMNDNTKMEAFADNPRLVGKVEDFPAIDSLISARSYDVLSECMAAIDGIQGQVSVIDVRTGDVLTWGALENVEGDIVYAPLLKRFCSSETYMPFVAADCLAQSKTSLEDSVDTGQGIFVLNDSVRIRDHNWRRGISYQYDTSATLDEFAKEIASASGVSEGETISVLKDFRTLLRKTLLGGRSVNIAGLGYFYLSAQSKGTEKAEDFTIANISGLRICFRANSDIRLFTGTTTRSDGLKFKDLDHINDSGSVGDGSDDGGETPDPDGGSGGNGEAPDPAA